MNILFLIGNGFDLNIGMKTKYSDFYKHYISIKSKSNAVNKLKKSISNNIENWSDLEFELGKYTKELVSENDFTEIYEDLTDTLAEYLQNEEDVFDFKKIDSKRLNKHLLSPEDLLPLADRNKLKEFKKKWSDQQWNINMITYNYTLSLEKILKYEGKGINLGNRANFATIIQKIEHIHGFIDKRMVLGVNDITQVSNKAFHKNQNILVDLIKSKCNQAQKHLVDDWAKEHISKAQIIYIFGSSIGDTDRIWWNLIGEQLKRDFRLVIFSRGKNISPRRPQRKIIEETKIRDKFLAQTKLKDDEKKIVTDKIFVATNTNMFDLKI